VKSICGLFGYTRQAYYQKKQRLVQLHMKEQLLLKEIRQIRQKQPRIGGRKLYKELKSFMISIGLHLGRDRFFDFLRAHGLLVERRRRYVHTTDSRHHLRTYRNLIKDMELTAPNQVYVADITYIRTLQGFCYLSLLTDANSRKIVGYNVSRSLSIEGSLAALKMALRQSGNLTGLIHHSDRGVQYCSYDYTRLLKNNNIRISMTEQNHVYENALAERVNGILKEEFLLGETLQSFEVAQKMVKQAVNIYNYERPHMSIGYDKPAQRHAA
jgi:transposase InsO family protein